jgi:hypothetical protein
VKKEAHSLEKKEPKNFHYKNAQQSPLATQESKTKTGAQDEKHWNKSTFRA